MGPRLPGQQCEEPQPLPSHRRPDPEVPQMDRSLCEAGGTCWTPSLRGPLAWALPGRAPGQVGPGRRDSTGPRDTPWPLPGRAQAPFCGCPSALRFWGGGVWGCVRARLTPGHQALPKVTPFQAQPALGPASRGPSQARPRPLGREAAHLPQHCQVSPRSPQQGLCHTAPDRPPLCLSQSLSCPVCASDVQHSAPGIEGRRPLGYPLSLTRMPGSPGSRDRTCFPCPQPSGRSNTQEPVLSAHFSDK